MANIFFIGGIDTDCGKTIATGLIARYFHQAGYKTITQKLVQTGGEGIADDIKEHRKIMGTELQDVDLDKTTCPFVYKHPASPHLAAKLENKTFDISVVRKATEKLCQIYDIVLLEGAGGLFVPITDNLLIIDFLKETNYPLILVTSSKLGSINHTLMSLELCKSNKVNLKALIYNEALNTDKLIINDSKEIINQALKKLYPEAVFYSISKLEHLYSTDFNFKHII